MAVQNFTAEELESEEWRDVPEFGTNSPAYTLRYQVSNLGRLRTIKTQVLTPSLWGEYMRITLFKGRQAARNFKMFGMHQLVAKIFIGPRPEGKLPNHKDGNKQNNRVGNLEYVTPSENSLHAIQIGLTGRGERVGTAKLTNLQAVEIVQRLAAGEMANDIALDYPVSSTVINQIRKNRIWKHIPRPANLDAPLPNWTKIHPERCARGDQNGSRKHHDRLPCGEDAHNTKVTAVEVQTIRDLYAAGDHTIKELASTFGLGTSQTCRIIKRTTWKHL